MVNIVLLGMSGSGKTTHGRLIAKNNNLNYLESGILFRNEIESGSSLGEKVKPYVEKGDLIPDDLVKQLLKPKINQYLLSKGIVFDGFPRNTEQARYLKELLAKNGTKVKFIFLLEIDEDTAKKRILETRQKKENSEDDNDEEIVEKRIHKQKTNIDHLVEFYTEVEKNKPFSYSSDSSVELVQDAIDGIIKEKLDKI